jgi:GT2 family glycosyltransferase
MHRVAAVVLNYRTPDLSLACARSVGPQLGPDDVLVLVDNQSGDGSAERLRAGLPALEALGPARVLLVESPVNGGFAAGNNLGIRAVDAGAYLLLNSDTVVRPGAVDRLLAALESDPRAGLVSPALVDPDGSPQVNCFRRHSPVSELLSAARTGPIDRLLERWVVPLHAPGAHDELRAGFEWTSFAAVLISRAVIHRVGLLDEGFFMYFEDVDYCLRVRAAGFELRHEPRAEVVHIHGASSQVEALAHARRRRPAYYYAARRRYFEKTFGKAGPALANALWTVGRGIAWLREVAGSKQPHACALELVDNWLG